MAGYAFDGINEVRQNSKKVFLRIYESYIKYWKLIYSKDDIIKILQKCLNESLYI